MSSERAASEGRRRREVAVAVVTYRRPDELARALGSVAAQAVWMPGVDVSVTVVDNDPGGSACDVVQSLRERYPFALRYVHERRAGVSHARNAALRATATADAVAFLDDDIVASPEWLAQLLSVQARTNASAVAGKVVNTFSGHHALRSAGFFVTPSHPTGTVVSIAGAGNLLLVRRALDRLGPDPFDLAFGLTGGEDSHLTWRLTRLGERIVWADDAVVEEIVPESRLTLRWAFFRIYRTGTTDGLLHVLNTRGGLRGRAACAVKGFVRLVSTPAISALGVLPGRHPYQGLRVAARGAGFLAAAFGARPQEYRRSTRKSRLTPPSPD